MKLITLISLLTLSISYANTDYFCNDSLETIPILQGGRVKPLLVHAKETFKSITGKTKVDGKSAVTAYCLLSLKSFGLPISIKAKAKIEHIELKKLFGLPNSESKMEFDLLTSKMNMIRSAAARIKEENSYKTSLSKLFEQVSIYNDITSGKNWLLAMSTNKQNISWEPISKIEDKKNLDNLKNKIEQSQKLYISNNSDDYLLEITYIKMHLVGWSIFLSLVALFTLVLFKNFLISLSFSAITVIVELTYLTLRTIISGRAPVTNMYETVLFSGLGALILALIIGHLKKDKIIVLVGLAYNVLSLFMITFAHGMFSSSIGPLVPVLRDNFWLATHVTTIILSYGALALSWVLSNTILFKKRFLTLSDEDLKRYSDIAYICLKYGTVLLAAGIILGGIWADYSWGRFWGWDPKETWSLIVLLIYMAIIHGKHTSWIPPHRFIPLTAGAFMSVMMAWFGVNYILASGLHSYGFSQGGAIFLFTFFALQIVFLIVTNTNQKLENN